MMHNPGESVNKQPATAQVDVVTPLDGTVAALSSVPHPVFATGSAGAGIAVVPDPGVEVVEIQAPVTGMIVRVRPHLFVLEADDCSARVLVQAGIDTDQLGGQGYATYVAEGAYVKVGTPIVTYTPKELGRLGFDPIVVVVAMSHEFSEINPVAMAGEPCNALDTLFRV